MFTHNPINDRRSRYAEIYGVRTHSSRRISRRGAYSRAEMWHSALKARRGGGWARRNAWESIIRYVPGRRWQNRAEGLEWQQTEAPWRYCTAFGKTARQQNGQPRGCLGFPAFACIPLLARNLAAKTALNEAARHEVRGWRPSCSQLLRLMALGAALRCVHLL